MCGKFFLKVFFLLSAVILLISCGEMGAVFLTGSSDYEVGAYVNGIAVKNKSIVKSGDIVRPAFLRYMSEDPDLTGLQVFIEDSQGIMLGDMVHYSLPGGAVPEQSGILRTIRDVNEEFDAFPLPEDLAIGQYTLNFNVMGGKSILYQSSQTMYFVSNLNFSIEGIRTYMPGKSEGSQLIPPNTTILLEAAITSDKNLDPYIIWYHEEQKIAEGKLSEHYHHLLWTVPKTEGFPKIRMEVFPFLAGDKPAKNTKGVETELSLVVSNKAALPHSFEENGGDALYWYQFDGNIAPSENSVKNDAVLVKTQESPPRWEPLSDIYGLVIGEDDSYEIPNFSVSLNNESDTEYDLYTLNTNFSPQNKGTLFQGIFKPNGSDLSSLHLEVLLEENEIVLSLQNGKDIFTESIPVEFSENKDFIITKLQFYAFQNQFSAFLELLTDFPNLPLQTKIISIPYKGSLSGDGTFHFGAKQVLEQEIPLSEDILEVQNPDIAIIDEFFLEQSRKTAALWDHF
jgi:hypothetical protein